MTKTPAPPIAARHHTETRLHGHVLVDDYRWLREKDNPLVIQYLADENNYADSHMQHTEELQKKLYAEMLSHIKETDVNVPWRKGEYFYYSRWEEGKQYQIHARKKGSLDAAEEITIDVNKLAVGESFMALRAYHVSDDGNMLAYSTDNTGFRQYKLRFRDLRTGIDLPEAIGKTGSVAWAADNRTIFYTVEDSAKRHYRVYRHVLGEAPSKDVLIYEEPDERFNVDVHRSRSGKYIFLGISSHTTTEARFIEAAAPTGEWRMFEPREQDIEYYPDHLGDHFFIRANDTGGNFRLAIAPVGSTAKAGWKDVVPVRANVMLESFEPFESFYVLYELEDGLPQFTVVDLASGSKTRVTFPEPVYFARPQVNREFKTGFFRYAYQSLVTPNSIFDYDVKATKSLLLKQDEVPGGYDASKYMSERVWATAPDGVKVPIAIVYRGDMKKADGSNPLFMDGYGSYGALSPPYFDSTRLCLLDRGVVMAYTQIRGGGDLGKDWHDGGRMMEKMNTFTDFIACAEHLAAQKYGARDNIVAEGGSAGGLLMGVISNLRPDLFRAIVSHVAFVDVMNTMLDASLPLTVAEYEEWGNPNIKEEFEYMLKYSPYDNLEAKAYPTMLLRTSLNDSQVMYWEPAKYAAKLRTMKTDSNVLLLKTNMSAGHGGASGRYDHLKETAFDYAFMLWQMGVTE